MEEDFAELLVKKSKDKGKEKPYAILDEIKIPYHDYMLDGKPYFQYVFFEDIPDLYKGEFNEWIYGQTVPVVEEDKVAIYAWDVERWFAWKLKRTDILIFD